HRGRHRLSPVQRTRTLVADRTGGRHLRGWPRLAPPSRRPPLRGVRGEPGTHRSTGVNSSRSGSPESRDRAPFLPSPNPSANSVGGRRGRNGEPPHVATPRPALGHALDRSHAGQTAGATLLSRSRRRAGVVLG